ncbi:MAG: hypothetical protein ACPG5B_17715 [Chitinophagales bacterium]
MRQSYPVNPTRGQGPQVAQGILPTPAKGTSASLTPGSLPSNLTSTKKTFESYRNVNVTDNKGNLIPTNKR